MSDWQAGDLALCIKNPNSDENPTRAGGVYEVEKYWLDSYGPALNFVGIFNGDPCPGISDFWGHRPERFIKVTPPPADEFDRETIALMKERVA